MVSIVECKCFLCGEHIFPGSQMVKLGTGQVVCVGCDEALEEAERKPHPPKGNSGGISGKSK